MNILIPKSAQITTMTGWAEVCLADYQISQEYLNNRGTYKYGYFNGGKSGLCSVCVGSNIRFAVIDGLSSSWQIALKSAFRHDCDFYIIDGIAPDAEQIITEMIGPSDAAAVLCIGVKASA